jgi:hypothetical protein
VIVSVEDHSPAWTSGSIFPRDKLKVQAIYVLISCSFFVRQALNNDLKSRFWPRNLGSGVRDSAVKS